MKNKIVLPLVVLMLSGCLNAGDYDLLPFRKNVISAINGYHIYDVDKEERMVGTEKINEKQYQLNKSITVKKGEAILSDKNYDRSVFRKIVFNANNDGVINNAAYPQKIKANEKLNVVGSINMDGKKYYLLASDIDDYVFLFDDNGDVYNKAGQIKNGSLIVLEEDLFVYPKNLKIRPVAKMRDEVSNVRNGYEVKYDGVKFGRIWFDHINYDSRANNQGHIEKLSFPNQPGLITIDGKGLRILNANDEALTFMVLKD